MVAEGVGHAQEIAEQIKDRVGFETRIMVLGHYQRGGSPSTFVITSYSIHYTKLYDHNADQVPFPEGHPAKYRCLFCHKLERS